MVKLKLNNIVTIQYNNDEVEDIPCSYISWARGEHLFLGMAMDAKLRIHGSAGTPIAAISTNLFKQMDYTSLPQERDE